MQENAVLQYGYLILCLTDNTTSGYSGDPLSVLDNQNNDKSKTIVVYPNPFNSSFTIQIPDYINKEIKGINLVDITGKSVFSTSRFYNKNGMITVTLNKESLSSGLYYGTLETDEENHIFKLTYIQ